MNAPSPVATLYRFGNSRAPRRRLFCFPFAGGGVGAFRSWLRLLPADVELIGLQLPGREHAWWVWADRGLFDEQGRLLEIQAVGRDNTEVRRSQRQLLQGAKMATLGELTTGLLHEINQPLNVMRMAAANALKRLENGTAEPAYLEDKLHRIEAQIERFAPGFRDRILARSTSDPGTVEAHNANYVGGDINGGVADLRQFVFRPVPSLSPWRTPVDGLYLCSSSTPPGGGVHGMCGRAAARLVLRDAERGKL